MDETMLPKEGPMICTSAARMVCIDIGNGIAAEVLEILKRIMND